MNEQMLKDRLALLRDEFSKGQQQLDHLDRQRAEVRDTLLRISGAIQVLEELAAGPPASIGASDAGYRGETSMLNGRAS
jgi:hypothetical protein